MEELILSEIGSVLQKPPTSIDTTASFIYNGGNSLSAAALASNCKAGGYSLTLRSILTSENLEEVIGSATVLPGKPLMFPRVGQMGETFSMSPLSLLPYNTQNHDLPQLGLPTGDGIEDFTESKRFSHDELPSEIPFLPPFPQDLSKLGVSRYPNLPDTPAGTPELPPYSNRGLASGIQTPASSHTSDLDSYPLLEMQLSLIHGSMKTPGMNVITHTVSFPSVNIPIMRLAWQIVMNQEPIFRLPALLPDDGEPFHWYDPYVDEDELKQNDYRALEAGQVGSFFEVVHQKPFHTPTSISTIIWRVHHALIDGFSADLLFDKVSQVTAGRSVQPSPDFSHTVKEYKLLQESRHEEGNAFWVKKSVDYPSAKGTLLLPSVYDQLEGEQSRSAERVLEMGPLYESLHVFAREINVTPAIIFNAAWALVLSVYTDSDTVMFGAVLSGRDLPLPDANKVIGPLVNTLPFFVTLNRQQTTKEFLRSIFEDMVELREYQWTTPDNGYSREFESALAVQSGQPKIQNEYVHAVGSTHTQQTTQIPLSVVIEGDGTLRFNYHYTRFSQQSMERLSSCYYGVLEHLVRATTTIGTILSGLMPVPEQTTLMHYGNALSALTTRPSIKQDLVTLFETSSRRTPNGPAVERGEESLTYKEFDEAASKIASRLRTTVSPGDVVCVHSDRSINWIVAIFGILKAGAVYCSLSSDLPLELRSSMYQSASAKVYLTPSAAEGIHCPTTCDTCLAVDEILRAHSEPIDAQALHRRQPVPWALAYLCFTSGSTGTPKGVMCTHEGLVAFQSDLVVRMMAQPGVKISQIMSPAFDGSIHEIFSALSYGASLVLQEDGDPFGHLSLVDSAILTPSMARVLNPDQYESLRNVYLVGEPVPQLVSEKWSSCKNLYNMYGPTEGTCGATIKHLKPGCQVTIGRPNPTTRIYILDSQRSLVPLGITGEIYLGGVQVAKGYLNLEEQTGESFLLDSICRNGEHMYKTGDRGYWNELGEIICLGRKDRQIKLRGFRLDMNDLEIRIMRAAHQLQAIAVAPRGDHLVAMVRPASTNVQELRTRISSLLPPYAIMQQILPVDQLPMTSAGKVDYRMVSQMAPDSLKKEMKAPRTPTEKAIASAFRSVLKLDETTPLTIESDFIQLGGHSLLQLSMTSRLTRIFDFRLPLRLIIENSTIKDMAESVDKLMNSSKPPLPRGQSLTAQQVSPIEREWLMKYDIDCGSACFNVCYTCTFDPKVVNHSALATAWNTILARHRLFRGRYVTRSGRPHVRMDAETAPLVERTSEINLWMEANRPFQVQQESPIRVIVARDRLTVVMSHIVADYTALAIVLREASAVYHGQQLRPLGKIYPDSSVWYDSVAPCYLEFWTQYMEGWDSNPPLLGKQQDRTGYRGTSSISHISKYILKQMLDYCDNTKLSLQQLVMAAVALCLQLDTAETDIVLGSPYINRNSDEDLEMMGLFLEPLPVRIKYPDPLPESQCKEDNSPPYLDAVQKSSQAALAHVMPWHQLLEHLNVTSSFPNHPLTDVIVSFHDNRQSQGLEMAGPGFESGFLWSEGAKFKLMAEFTAISENTLVLRTEYDTECVSAEDVAMMEALVPRALELLVQGGTHDDIKKALNEKTEGKDYYERLDPAVIFGKKLCEL